MTDIDPISFIVDQALLKEDYKVSDLFDIDLIAKKFESELLNAPNKSIIGLVGEYGIGKSTLLHNISTTIANDYWIEFDAWKYPERKELWEGFVLDLARQIDKSAFEMVRKSLDGKQNDDKKTLVNTVGSIPGLAAIKNLTHFFETSPARRTFEIQSILQNFIENKAAGKTIYIVVEDIDRSGDAGMFFLETLKYFLHSIGNHNSIKVIVPIANKKFYEHTDSYIKCLDVVEFYKLSDIKMSKFVDSVFIPELISEKIIKRQVIEFLERIVQDYAVTPRKLKLMLRKADLNYINQQVDGFAPDFRMSMMFEFSKFIDSTKSESLFDLFVSTKTIKDNTLFSTFAYAVSEDQNVLDFDGKLETNPQYFKLIKRSGTIEQQPSTPYHVTAPRYGDDHYSFCCDFYLNY